MILPGHLADDLMNEIISNISWIDANRPSTLTIWLLAESVASFRSLTEWTLARQQEEWAPVESEE